MKRVKTPSIPRWTPVIVTYSANCEIGTQTGAMRMKLVLDGWISARPMRTSAVSTRAPITACGFFLQ